MHRVLSAMRTIFIKFDPVGVVFLILVRVVIPVLTFRASQRDFISRSFCSHVLTFRYQKINTPVAFGVLYKSII